MEEKKLYYYRIYDDKEQKSYFKSSLNHKELEALIKEFEKTHKKYINATFVKFVQKTDPSAELFKIQDLSY